MPIFLRNYLFEMPIFLRNYLFEMPIFLRNYLFGISLKNLHFQKQFNYHQPEKILWDHKQKTFGIFSVSSI